MKYKIKLHCATLAVALSVGSLGFAQSTNQNEEFPELGKSYLKTGAFVDSDHVRRVELAALDVADGKSDLQRMNKDQVRLELGHPHFNEGIGNNKVWNYAFNFHTGARKSQEGKTAPVPYVTCQFQIKFDDHDRVIGIHWKDAGCAAFTLTASKS